MEGCKVCDMKSLGAAKVRAFHMGSISIHVVARDLNCTPEDVMKHINEQHDLVEGPDGKLDSEDLLLKKLSNSMTTLEEWTSYIISSVTAANQVDRAKVDMLVKLTQETRKTVESIAELQGRRGPGDTHVQIQVLNSRVIGLTNAVLDSCCPECRIKVLETMERQPKLLKEIPDGSVGPLQ